MESSHSILAVDPGRDKCGLAIIQANHVKLSEVVLRTELVDRIKQVLPEQGPIIIGDGTGSKEFKEEIVNAIDNISSRIILLDEHMSTVEAKALYWELNPPTGWRRLLPVSLQTPPVPIDDYVAIILARRYQETEIGKL